MMGESVFCSICSMSVGLRLLCSSLVVLHILIGILIFIPDKIFHVANFMEFIFCSNITDHKDISFKTPIPRSAITCSATQSFIVGLLAPYGTIFNLFMLFSSGSLILTGWFCKWLCINFIIVYSICTLQMFGFAAYLLTHFSDRQEVCRVQNTVYIFEKNLQGYFVLLSCFLLMWITAVGVMAARKKTKEESRLHSVKILVNDSEEPILLEDDSTQNR